MFLSASCICSECCLTFAAMILGTCAIIIKLSGKIKPPLSSFSQTFVTSESSN